MPKIDAQNEFSNPSLFGFSEEDKAISTDELENVTGGTDTSFSHPLTCPYCGSYDVRPEEHRLYWHCYDCGKDVR